MRSQEGNEQSAHLNHRSRSIVSASSVAHRRASWTVVLLLALVLAPGFGRRSVHAQDSQQGGTGVFHSDTLEMAVRAGFGRLEVNTFAGSWVPVRVTVANQGDPISGRLVVKAESSQA